MWYKNISSLFVIVGSKGILINFLHSANHEVKVLEFLSFILFSFFFTYYPLGTPLKITPFFKYNWDSFGELMCSVKSPGLFLIMNFIFCVSFVFPSKLQMVLFSEKVKFRLCGMNILLRLLVNVGFLTNLLLSVGYKAKILEFS